MQDTILNFDNFFHTAELDEAYKGHIDRYEVDVELKPVCETMLAYDKDFIMPTFINLDAYVQPIDYLDNGKRLLCFNGGKISLACALRAKNSGQDVSLFYVKSTNKHVEEKEVRELAEMLDMPLIMCTTGIVNFDKSPFRNMMILTYAINYAVENKYSLNIIYGTFDNAFIAINHFKDFRNTVEWMDCYSNMARKILPKFKISRPMPGYSFVWDELMNNRQYVYHIRCNDEIEEMILYIAKIDHRLQEEENTSLYIQYIRLLKKRLKQETGKEVKDIYKLWNRYMFYNIERSKHYGELMNLLR